MGMPFGAARWGLERQFLAEDPDNGSFHLQQLVSF
jgi:hypothetical protein